MSQKRPFSVHVPAGGFFHETIQETDQYSFINMILLPFLKKGAILLALCGMLGGGVLVLVAGVALWRYHRVAVKQFGGITGDLAGWFLQKAELYMLAALVFCQWKGFL